jgi:hypothetical protein
MLSLFDATVPVFTKALGGVERWLDTALKHAESKNFDVQRLLDAWLAPDQYNFTRQIQSACDYAKFGTSKLAGKEPPARPDTETTVTDLRARLKTEIEYLGTFTRADFIGGEDRACAHAWMNGKWLRGGDYLDHVVLPNFHFHLTSAYAIFRHSGVELGKMDYLGALPYQP